MKNDKLDDIAQDFLLKTQMSPKEGELDTKNTELHIDIEEAPSLKRTEILEEALLRNSIRKCELWLQKYF